MQGLISIIVPVYNRQAYLAECLDSIAAQTYQNYEVILIDDGSTDRSLEICREYAQRDNRIRWIQGDHAGVSSARNKGLDQAKGEFVFFVDSDDVIHPNLLQALAEGLKNMDAAMAGTYVISVTEEKWHKVPLAITKSQGLGETIFMDFEKTIDAVFHGETPLAVIGGVMMRRDLIADTRFNTHLFIGEDFYFIYENLIKGPNTLFLKQRWYYARLHGGNTWTFGYDGFMNRLQRRELIWSSEEKAGRQQNANAQKIMVYGSYTRSLQYISVFCEDARKMRKELKKQKKIIVPPMKWTTKLRFYGDVYFPVLTAFMHRKKKDLP